jgi:hypothetical protein
MWGEIAMSGGSLPGTGLLRSSGFLPDRKVVSHNGFVICRRSTLLSRLLRGLLRMRECRVVLPASFVITFHSAPLSRYVRRSGVRAVRLRAVRTGAIRIGLLTTGVRILFVRVTGILTPISRLRRCIPVPVYIRSTLM